MAIVTPLDQLHIPPLAEIRLIAVKVISCARNENAQVAI